MTLVPEAGISDRDKKLQYSVRCNYLSRPEIPDSGTILSSIYCSVNMGPSTEKLTKYPVKFSSTS